MNPDTARKAIRRSILKQEGRRRVDVMLDRPSFDDLSIIRSRFNLQTAEAVAYALAYVADIARGEGPSQPLTRQAL